MHKTEKIARIAGGRAFLDPVSLALFLPLMLVSSVLTVEHAGNLNSLICWLIANLVSFAFCALVVIFLIRVPFKNRGIKPVPVYLVFIVGAFLGLSKGAITSFVAWRLGYFNSFEDLFINRIAQTTLVGVLAIPSLSVLSEFRFRFQDERDTLVLRRVRAELSRSQNSLKLSTADEGLVLLKFIQQAKSMFLIGASTGVAELIRNIIENSLRPLSHKLWHIESSKIEDYTFKALVQFGLRNHPFLYKPMLSVFAPISFLYLLTISGPLQALGSTIIATLAILATYAVANALKPSGSVVSLPIFGLVNAFVTTLVMICPAMVFGQNSHTWNAGLWLSTFILIFEIGFLSLFIAAIISNHNLTRDQLEALQVPYSAKAAIEDRELANFLHGNVQNRLLAIALSIESNQVDELTVVAELDRIEKLLLDEFVHHNPHATPSLNATLDNLRERWRGFVNLELEFFGSKTFSHERSEVLGQLINEAITNSVRHGFAKNIQIQITQNNSSCVIVVSDDGIGLRQGSRGLGSDYFDYVAGQDWSLEPGEFGGTVLKLSLS